MAKLRTDGMRVLRVQLQDDGPLDPENVKLWRALGFKVWGAVRPSNQPLHNGTWTPHEAAEFFRDEKLRMIRAGTNLAGADWNFEREVRDADNATTPHGQWSAQFVPYFRSFCPTLPAHLDSVYGDFAGGINNVYTPGIRFSVQTYWGAEGLWDDPPTNIVKWCAGAQPVIPKAVVKLLVRVVPNSAGQLPDWEAVFSDWKASGLLGGSWYYIDGADFDLVRWLTREAIRRGCAY